MSGVPPTARTESAVLESPPGAGFLLTGRHEPPFRRWIAMPSVQRRRAPLPTGCGRLCGVNHSCVNVLAIRACRCSDSRPLPGRGLQEVWAVPVEGRPGITPEELQRAAMHVRDQAKPGRILLLPDIWLTASGQRYRSHRSTSASTSATASSTRSASTCSPSGSRPSRRAADGHRSCSPAASASS